MLEVNNLGFSYPEVQVNASFRLKRGQCVALMGASGSGKSTLIDLIAGFVSPQRGEVRFDGKILNSLKPAERPLTVLFQSGNLFQHFSVWQNVAIGLNPGLKLDTLQSQQVADALKRVNLSGYESRKPGSLSGGQRQRVALARCFVREQPLLLLDEPFSALDQELRMEMLEIVETLLHQKNLAVLLATHMQDEAEKIANVILRIDDGCVNDD